MGAPSEDNSKPPPLKCRHCGTFGSPIIYELVEDPDGSGFPIGTYLILRCSKCDRLTVSGLSASITEEEGQQLEKQLEDEPDEWWNLDHEGLKDQSDE